MRLLVDSMCGGVVTYLRMCGYDTVFAGDRGLDADDELLEAARTAHRTIVTRDVALAERTPAVIVLSATSTDRQLATLAAAGLDLSLAPDPRYCGACNGRLESLDEGVQTPEYAPDPDETDVWRCLECGQDFWKGSHWDRVGETLAGIDPDADWPRRDADGDQPERDADRPRRDTGGETDDCR